jgi:copper(I)-binding protein
MKLAAAALLAVLSFAAHAADIEVRDAWSRATAPGAKVAAGYLEVRNPGAQADRLVSAASPLAKRVELHVTERDGEIVKMRQVKHYDIRARGGFVLAPGGAHLMLVDIVRPLKKGDRVPLKLRFERAGEVDVVLEVRDLAARGGHQHH